MSREELKASVNQLIDQLPDNALEKVEQLLKELQQQPAAFVLPADQLDRILSEDEELLKKLAQ